MRNVVVGCVDFLLTDEEVEVAEDGAALDPTEAGGGVEVEFVGCGAVGPF